MNRVGFVLPLSLVVSFAVAEEAPFTRRVSEVDGSRSSAEALMDGAEKFAAWAEFIDPQTAYPAELFRELWTKINSNQSRPFLSVSPRHDVALASAKDYEDIFARGGAALARSLDAIAARVHTAGEGIPVLVFNPLSWERSDIAVVSAPWTAEADPRVLDAATGKDVPSQAVRRAGGKATVVFHAAGVPSIGYKLFRLREGSPRARGENAPTATEDAVEGPFFRVEVDRATGNVKRLVDKRSGREALAPGWGPRGWHEAETARRGRELNEPLVARIVPPHVGTFPVAASFLRIEPENVIVGAVKREEGGAGLLVGFYETHGKETEATLALPATPKEAREVDDLTKRPVGETLKTEGARVKVLLKPYEIKTLRVTF